MMGVLYMLVGNKHDVNLVVSLLTLRDWYTERVHIVCGCDHSYNLGLAIQGDGRLGDVTISFDDYSSLRQSGGRSYSWKTKMHELSPFSQTLFLDADTLIVGDFLQAFPGTATDERLRLTQFANWRTGGSKISGRLKAWEGVEPRRVKTAIERNSPAINTGVIGFSQASRKSMDLWKEVTMKKAGQFIADETAMDLIAPEIPHVVLSDRYNCSMLHSDDRSKMEAKIIHTHGRKAVKHPENRKMFWPHYLRACKLNLAKISDWTPSGDQRLKAYLKDPKCYG